MSVFSSLYTHICFCAVFNDADSQTLEETNILTSAQIQKPPLYKIIMLNDDYTPMDFVVYVLETIFQKNNEEATKIMFQIHNTGFSVCGAFTYEIAETKKKETIELATKYQYPLQCILEKE
ncbi:MULTISPECIES: ATP-dependent Clp protease adaptor ClpS [Commensalibacter]|uniref:ATP-dependent Clp protease adapter protein ClpS n=2 Tax=Commensalibacter TaxID=1079922 RepID=W7DP28_9PROT|nr:MULTISPECIES: ATP-dependent Clp protease adaptor ClpS [Commensalibacter]EUK19087.1 Clp protease adaptor protein [Commensalibacter papalotli (ex Servin-Garciduenas et al. 2014)]CAI3922834.1 ATP-dependent Clp protease adapter protein ClpS (ClpS) (PDB:1LZW) [Commensalibacter papalotli (ex Botero et al. 2024)]CAI3929235.1 ATP-dependent Clp protease adapter protein ClpS (ClpS) (PDB:1LZW) [Commensalibacter papalotli (ex Botero et al. 2024)]